MSYPELHLIFTEPALERIIIIYRITHPRYHARLHVPRLHPYFTGIEEVVGVERVDGFAAIALEIFELAEKFTALAWR
jgi:hypothetical protein